MRRNYAWAWLSSGLAATLVAFFWLALPAPSVSAQTLLSEFQRAIAQGLTMNLRDIDLGSVRIDGRILINQLSPVPDAQTDALFSELHVKLIAGNPEWEDIDGVSVVCQTPDAAWRYCRGNGGSATDAAVAVNGERINNPSAPAAKRRVTPTSYFVEKPQVDELMWNLLGEFGGMPIKLTFHGGGSSVDYQFPLVQREYVRALNVFLMQLASPAGAERLLAALREDCPDAQVERGPDRGAWILRVPNLARSRALAQLPHAVPLPDLDSFLRDFEISLTYDARARHITEMTWGELPKELTQAGLWPSIQTFNSMPADAPAALQLPLQSAEALHDHLRQHAKSVAVTMKSGSRTAFRVKGLPLPFDTSAYAWVSQLDELSAGLELRVYYDADSKTVRRAELLHVAGPGGRIEIELGPVMIDAALIDPQRYRGAEEQ